MFFLFYFLVVCISFNVGAVQISVIGNKSIELETIKLYAQIDQNDITDRSISKALKRVYKTGFFSDVKITHNTDSVEINVTETPIIKKVEFNGSRAIGKDKILEELTSKEKKFFSKIDILNDVKRLTLIYQKLGYLNVDVRPLVEFLEDSTQVVVIFDITEGKKVQIGKINIDGNKYFSDTKIKDDGLKIRQRSILKFNFGASFDIEQIENEQESIKRFYQTRGFPKIKIQNVVSKFNVKKNLFYVFEHKFP
jgi:outer membrane protein insertion porin family